LPTASVNHQKRGSALHLTGMVARIAASMIT
jgi:hypothetical protein